MEKNANPYWETAKSSVESNSRNSPGKSSGRMENDILLTFKPDAPQGFRLGQLKKRGHRFCLRNCGMQFDSEESETEHYRLEAKGCVNHFLNMDLLPYRLEAFVPEETKLHMNKDENAAKEAAKKFIIERRIKRLMDMDSQSNN